MFQKAVSKAEIVGDTWGGFVGNLYIVLYVLPDGEITASEGYCSQDKCMLNYGYLDGYEIECSCHGGRFNVRTGQVTAPPPEEPIWMFAVEVRDDDIYVDI